MPRRQLTSEQQPRCLMCGQPIGPRKPSRVCGICKRPILKGHKFYFDSSMVRHRNCDRPDSYEQATR